MLNLYDSVSYTIQQIVEVAEINTSSEEIEDLKTSVLEKLAESSITDETLKPLTDYPIIRGACLMYFNKKYKKNLKMDIFPRQED